MSGEEIDVAEDHFRGAEHRGDSVIQPRRRQAASLTARPLLLRAVSAGAGRAAALKFAQSGARLMLIGRYEGALQQTKTTFCQKSPRSPQTRY